MKELSSPERLARTLRRETVDRVPTFEWLIDRKVIAALSPGSSYEEFCYEFDLDAICVDCDYESRNLEGGKIQDEWGMIKLHTAESHSFPLDGPIRTMEDVLQYKAPDPLRSGRYDSVERAVRTHEGKKAVILHLNDVFSIPSRLMPFEHFMMLTIDDPDAVRALVEISVDTNLKMAEEAAKRGIKIVYTGDDVAYKSGPIVSPDQFRDLFLPGLQRVMRGYKELGLLVIKHTDGDIMPLIDMIVDTGIDCLDPIDPTAGMDLGAIKRDYGSRIALKGNVDCAQTLTFGSLEDTIAETKRCLEIGMPGGGYILSSSNSIHSEVKPENYLALLETVRRFGTYP